MNMREKIARQTAEFLASGGSIACYDNNNNLVELKSVDDSPISAEVLASEEGEEPG